MAKEKPLSSDGEVVIKASSEMSQGYEGVSERRERAKRASQAREDLYSLSLGIIDFLEDDAREADVNVALERLQTEERGAAVARIASGIWQLASGRLVFVEAHKGRLEAAVDDRVMVAYCSWSTLKKRL